MGKNLTRRKFLSGAAGIGAAALASPLVRAVGSLPVVRAASAPQGRVVFGMWQNPDTLDPGASGLISSGYTTINMFDPLVWRLPGMRQGQEYFPGLAERWEVSPDARRYTFYLRKDVKFHDGTPLTARAVKDTFEHIMNPETRSRGARPGLASYQRTDIQGEHAATVVFGEPNAAFMNNVCTPGMAPSSPKALAEMGHRNYGQRPVGTGPFMFKEWVPGSHVTLIANPDYNWGPTVARHQGPPHVAEVTFRIIPDASTRFNALRTGEVLLAENLSPPDITLLQRTAGFIVYTAQVTGMPYSIWINSKRPPTDDLKVRQALQLATDQEAIVEALYSGIYKPAHNIFLPTTVGYDPALDKAYRFDQGRAKALLDEAGWTMGPGGVRQKAGQPLRLRFVNIAGFGFDQITQLMQAQWQEVGVQSDIVAQGFPLADETYKKGEHHLANFFFYAVDPFFMRSLYTCDQIGQGFNYTHFCNPQFDELVARSNASADPAKRIPLIRQAAKMITDAAIVIPIYQQRAVFGSTNRVQALRFTVNGFPIFYDVTLRA